MRSFKKVFACIFTGENAKFSWEWLACLLRRIEGMESWASGNAVGFFHGHKVSSEWGDDQA